MLFLTIHTYFEGTRETYRILSDDELAAAFAYKERYQLFELPCEIQIVPVPKKQNFDLTKDIIEELAGDFNFWLFICYCLCFGILCCLLPLNLMQDKFFVTGLVATFFFAFGIHSRVWEDERERPGFFGKKSPNKQVAEKLRKLKEMGFNDRKKNSKILSQKSGSLEESLEELIAQNK